MVYLEIFIMVILKTLQVFHLLFLNLVGQKMFQLEEGEYFQSDLVNWEMAEEEQKDKRITPVERARSQQFQVLGNYFGNLENEIIHSPSKCLVRVACL